jgi:hypothetical protein
MNLETHVTIRVADAPVGVAVAKNLNWKTSEIKRDPILGDNSYFYLTSHGNDFGEVWLRLLQVVEHLQKGGATVLRTKIELIIHDSKTGV